MKKIITILLFLMCFTAIGASAQTVTNGSYSTVAHFRSDGTVMDASYSTIGHAQGVPMKWAAFYFFFL